jgi:hypothetical protein
MIVHDRSKNLEEFENEKIIKLVENENAQVFFSQYLKRV